MQAEAERKGLLQDTSRPGEQRRLSLGVASFHPRAELRELRGEDDAVVGGRITRKRQTTVELGDCFGECRAHGQDVIGEDESRWRAVVGSV